MLLGLLGCASHSSLHSLNINSFNVYTLMLNGSFFPLSVVPGIVTLRFVRYLSSILYGCLAPDVSSNVITRTGTSLSPATGEAGPVTGTMLSAAVAGGNCVDKGLATGLEERAACSFVAESVDAIAADIV
jgi:hypothetical protein